MRKTTFKMASINNNDAMRIVENKINRGGGASSCIYVIALFLYAN